VVDPQPSREFLLLATCCRRPLSDVVIRSITVAAAAGINWRVLLAATARHRVGGLVYDALLTAKIDLPAAPARSLARRADRIAARNKTLAAETAKLQGALMDAGVPALALKGVALAELAYGVLDLKHTWDIDLLVLPRDAEAALRLIEEQGYALAAPLNAAQRRAAIRYGKDIELMRGDVHVELQWRAVANRRLLLGIDAASPGQDVALDGARVRTLAEPDLFAYLSVHGASHFWSRLKWLADLNALIVRKNGGEIVALYRHAQAKGAGLCAGQALLLCHRLFDRALPGELAGEFAHSPRLEKLVALALRAMALPDPAADRGLIGVAQGVLAQFLLGCGWAFFAEQCRIGLVGQGDIALVPLPPGLQFLYPLLRLPLWLWRRLCRS
jgi:hypothetical protein